jgi:hypothetical protein
LSETVGHGFSNVVEPVEMRDVVELVYEGLGFK